MSDALSSFWLALATVFGVQGGPIADPPTLSAVPEAPISCRLDVVGSGDRKTITAVVSARDAAQSGQFAMEIEKTGANTMKTRQGGDFELAASETKSLATVKVNVSSADTLSGRLLLNWNGGDATCLLNNTSSSSHEKTH